MKTKCFFFKIKRNRVFLPIYLMIKFYYNLSILLICIDSLNIDQIYTYFILKRIEYSK